MTDDGRTAGPARCTRCGGELRFRRRPVRAEFGGQWERVEVETSECVGCGDLSYHRATASPRGEGSAAGGRQDHRDQRRSEDRRS